ncbi:MAG TPA: carboxypeptidase regulatory-like domain-containing protein, partial [Pyrinomonadaceae bacterium]|nr:carboxypeptidase regulatory-like domain-containing protein [Pyrinomonadaceae bacterium]
RKLAGTGETLFNLPFNNTGTVNLQPGILNFGVNGTHTGSFTGAAGTAFKFSSATLQAASSVSAPTVSFIAGANTIAGTYNASSTTNVNANATFSGTNITSVGSTLNVTGSATFNSNSITAPTINLDGTIGGSADLSPTATGTLNFNGTLNGTGTTNIAAGATLNLGGAQPQLKRVLNNAGTANYSPTASMVFVGGTFNNQTGATFNVQSDTQLFQSGGTNAFNNAGTVRKTTGASEANFNLPFSNTGTVEVQAGTIRFASSYTQTAGLTFLNGGNFASNSTLDVQGGELRGAGTINGNLSNGGTLNPGTSPGCLNVTGNYTQTSGGTLNIEIGGTSACTQFDQLNINGSATLAGTLSINLVNGFSASAGQSFQIAAYASHTGTFASVTGPLPATVNATNVTVAPVSTFQISGHVQDSGGSALSGISINLTGSQTTSTTTDSSGNYTFASLAANGNYTVTPSSSCYTFAPTNRVFNNLSANQTGDFNGTQLTFTISGRIADALNNPVSGLTLNLTGSQTANTTTDANGNYTFTAGCGGNYTITPVVNNYEFNPTTAQFNSLSANQTADFIATPSVFTPAGNNVSVAVGGFGLTYQSVSASGRTRATPIIPASAGLPPANTTIVTNAPAADLSTTATFAGIINV